MFFLQADHVLQLVRSEIYKYYYNTVVSKWNCRKLNRSQKETKRGFSDFLQSSIKTNVCSLLTIFLPLLSTTRIVVGKTDVVLPELPRNFILNLIQLIFCMILPSIKYYFIALFIAYKIYYARLSVIFYIQMDFVHPCLSCIRKKELGCGLQINMIFLG